MLKHSNNKFLRKGSTKSKPLRSMIWWRVVPQKSESFVASFPSRNRRFLQVIQPRPKEQLFVVSVSHGQHASALDFLKTILLADMLMWFTPLWLSSKSSSHTQCLWIWIMTFVDTLFSSSFINIVDLSRTCDFSER